MSNTIDGAGYARINQALIGKGWLNAEATTDLESFGPASQEAYCDYLRNSGLPQVTNHVVPQDWRDVPSTLLDEEEASDEVEHTEEDEELEDSDDDLPNAETQQAISDSVEGNVETFDSVEAIVEDADEEEETEDEDEDEEGDEDEEEDQ